MRYGVEQFLLKVNKTKTCWLWTGSKTLRGYGRCEWGTHKMAHRVSYEFFIGPIPLGLQINHKCDNPPCVNPDHLYVGTQSDNLRDASRRMRIPSQKLNYAKAKEIRRVYENTNTSMRELGKTFGVSDQTICDVINKVSYI